MSTKMPPVPPENRSHKGPGSAPEAPKSTGPKPDGRPENPAQQDQEGNTRINTTGQGGHRAR